MMRRDGKREWRLRIRCGSVTFACSARVFAATSLSDLSRRVCRVSEARRRAEGSETQPKKLSLLSLLALFPFMLIIDLTSKEKIRAPTRLYASAAPLLLCSTLSFETNTCIQESYMALVPSVAVLALGLNLDPALVATIECVQFCLILSAHRQHYSRFECSIVSSAHLPSARPRAQTSSCRRFPLGVAGCCSWAERRCRAG